MRIFLLRHAESESGARGDPTRPLTASGEQQARIMAGFLKREIGHADIVLTSYFKRAADTAKPVAEALGAPVAPLWQLHPDADVSEAAEAVKRHGHGDVVVVTHHPLVNHLLKKWTGCNTDEVGFHHGHCAHVKGGRLAWFVGPKMVARDESVTEAAIAVADAVLLSLPLQEANVRRDAALEIPYARAARAVRRHFGRQQKALINSLTGVREAAPAPDPSASFRAVLAAMPIDDAIQDLFDDALTAALAAAAAHTEQDFGYSDAGVFDTFEANYLAHHGFRRVTGEIDKTTIKEVSNAVAKAYQSGADYQGIVDTIRHTFADFSDYRVNLIAQTELNNAYNAGIMELGRSAGADLKAWVTTGPNPCPACVENEAAGKIPIEQLFPSGDQMPVAHPGCFCSLEVHAAGARA